MKKRVASREVPLLLFDPRLGQAAFKLERFSGVGDFGNPRRTNYFTVLFVSEGKGRFHADLSEYDFEGPALLFLNPYQVFFLTSETEPRGACLQFHANFLCIETHHEEVGCNGVLFNDIRGQTPVRLDAAGAAEFESLLSLMEEELRAAGLAHAEALVSCLKLFLIKASRVKLEQRGVEAAVARSGVPEVLRRLTELIEERCRTPDRPADYASALHMTPKALGRLAKRHLGRTLTELIREARLKHARWQLLHTRRPVKEIAWEAGFSDELYFSRVFRRAAGCSPTSFREFETAIRGGRNLSM